MKRAVLAVIALCLIPAGATIITRQAIAAPASFSAAQSLVATSSSPGNSYAAGASIVLTAPVAGDFLACGGSVIIAAPVSGDNFILAGSISSRASMKGDFRAAGGSIDVNESIAGDLVALGYSVRDTGRVRGSVFIVAANATISDGALGPVTIYGNNISLAGDFSSDVSIIASGRVALAPGTMIRGSLAYESPDKAVIPASATVVGGITYTNAAYLPDVSTSRMLAFVSIGFFIIARIIGALILAGILAGLFPKFAEAIVDRVFQDRPRDILLAELLGFAILVATPIVVAMLLLTFVGIGLALLILILYALLFLLSLVYAGILIGGMLSRRFIKREQILWHDGVLGTAILSLIALVPVIGPPIALLLMLFAAGILLQTFFRFAFPRHEGSDVGAR